MAYKLLEEKNSWKSQLHEKFGFDRVRQCGTGSGSVKQNEGPENVGDFQFSSSYESPMQKSEQKVFQTIFYTFNLLDYSVLWIISEKTTL